MGENAVGVAKSYLEYFKEYGQVIMLSPNTFIPDLDLLVLPGGKDIVHGNPDDFSFYMSDNERFLEYFDKFTLPKYIENQTPIYAICRGFQAICRHFNIPIIPHIYWNHGYSKDETDTKANDLSYLKYQELFGHGRLATIKIGSWHHQGVSMASMENNPDFDVIAFTKDVKTNTYSNYNIVEFIEHKTLPIIAEQSHPERNQNSLEDFLIRKLLKEI